jgi:hypothetical protein
MTPMREGGAVPTGLVFHGEEVLEGRLDQEPRLLVQLATGRPEDVLARLDRAARQLHAHLGELGLLEHEEATRGGGVDGHPLESRGMACLGVGRVHRLSSPRLPRPPIP